MNRIISSIVLALLAAAAEASQYYYAPLGPWGLESTIINAKATRKDSELKKVKTTSVQKDKKDKKDEIKQVKSNPDEDDLEKAEEAFFHAVEEVEHAVEKAIDDEVETLFPHHKTESE
jgi:hydroxymethylpyrimidine pyrophosphatase-like HAD family hydrolase